MSNVFSIANDIPITGFNELGREQNTTLDKGLRICREANLKCNKNKCLFRYTSIPSFDEVVSQEGVIPNSRKAQALKHMPPYKSKRELQIFLGILNYLNKFSPASAELCEPL